VEGRTSNNNIKSNRKGWAPISYM